MLSVVVCTYNRSRYLVPLLTSLQHPENPECEVIVVDNNSTDGTRECVEAFAQANPGCNVRYVQEPRQGLSYARNCGISSAKGDIIVFVDDDALVAPGYLKSYADFFERNPEAYAAGGPIIPQYECGKEPSWMNHHLRRLLTGYLYFGKVERPFPGSNYPGGGNAAYRTKVFDAVGLFNPELGRKGSELTAGEEKDIFRKMASAGLGFMYLPQCVLYHQIPDYKLEREYFEKLTSSIGKSERARTLAVSGAAYCKRLFAEAVKWGGTLVLSIWYALTLRPRTSGKLLRFRYNVTRNLLKTI